MTGKESFTHFRADFEGGGAYGRAEPDQYLFRLQRQGVQSRLQHAAREPAPPGMGSRHAGSGTVAEQHRQAIGGEHGAGNAELLRPAGVGFIDPARVGLDHADAMHLAQPGGLAAEG
ncbi:hypothetical protein D3C85_1321210 [compost metagenome]